jgi:YebC/PmpR family DNA-binding regulatory protein
MFATQAALLPFPFGRTIFCMSGHNKWSKIKRQKGAADLARSAAFGKLARRITVESKKCGGDVNSVSLRAVIDKAREMNMPKENIERAVSKGTSTDAGNLESVTYEAYGPGGVAIIIDALTDNRNRTAQEVKHILTKNGLALAAQGSAAWAFQKTHDGYIPQTMVTLSESDGERLGEIIDLLDENDDVEEVYTNAE